MNQRRITTKKYFSFENYIFFNRFKFEMIKSIAVIGAGLAGTTFASLLKRNYDVKIFEKKSLIVMFDSNIYLYLNQ